MMAALADVCRQHPLDEKILIVPRYRAGHELLLSLNQADLTWVNLHISTVRAEAMKLLALDLARNNQVIVDHRQTVTLIQEILAELQRAGKLSYYPDEVLNDMAENFAGALYDLRLAGIESGQIQEDQFVSPAKAGDTKLILGCFEEKLRDRGLVDFPGLLNRASDALASENPMAGRIVMIPGHLKLLPTEEGFLTRLACDQLICLDSDFTGSRGIGFNTDPQIFRAYGEANEAREVLRRIKDNCAPFDQVQVIYTNGQVYNQILYNECQRLGIPATFADGISLMATRSGRLCAGLLSWVAQDFNARILWEIMTGGDMDLPSKCRNTDGQNRFKAARILRGSGVGWGRGRYVFEESWLQEELAEVIAVIPEPGPEGEVDIAELASGLRQVLIRWRHLRGDLDEEGFVAAVGLLEDYSSCTGTRLRLEEATDRISKVLANARVGRSGPQPGHLHVISYKHAGWLLRKHTFIIGLSAAYFPGAGLQDPVLLDSERARINTDLPLYRNIPGENTEQMVALISSLRGSLTLSYPSFDILQGRTNAPAALMLEAYRYKTGDPSADYSQMDMSLPPPVGYLTGSKRCLDVTDWWVGVTYPARGQQTMFERVLSCYPLLSSGNRALTERARETFGAYDGRVGGSADAMDPRECDDLVMSCSRIELLARCPFAYFLKYVLRIKPPEEVVFDPSSWLDAMTRGSLLHEVFCRFMEEASKSGRRVRLEDDLARLMEIADEVIQKYKDMIPPPSATVFKAERQSILQACEIFLRVESENTVTKPRYFELAFGEGDDEPEEGNAAPAFGPVRIELGGGKSFLLRGRVDRVDEVSRGLYWIWDYKTGGTYGYDELAYFKRGRQVQHALYALAIEALLPAARVEKAGYLFPSEKGEGQSIVRLQDRRDDLRKVINLLFDLLAGGTFPACDDGEGCSFCDYQTICEPGDAVEAIKGKLQDSCLRPWEELKTYD